MEKAYMKKPKEISRRRCKSYVISKTELIAWADK